MLPEREKTPLWVRLIQAVLAAILLFYAGSFVSYLWTLEDFLLAQGF